MNILKALIKQLLGAKYERIAKSLIACIITFLAIRTAEIKIEIAPFILFLTATAFSAGIMWQALHSSGNADRMIGLFMLPFGNRKMTIAIVLAFTGYTLITKTLLVLTLFFAVYEWSAVQIAVSLLCACNGCFIAAAWYTWRMQCTCCIKCKLCVRTKKRKQLPAIFLWCATVLLSIFFVQDIVFLALIILASLCLSVLRLLTEDAYGFYRPASAKQLIRHTKGTGSIFLYLLRYLMTNKSYILNTAGLCLIAAFLPVLLGQFEGLYVMPLGLAILCLNTPICILLSCDPDLEQAVRILPGQAYRFCSRYCIFIFLVNMAVSSVYLVSWQVQKGGVGGTEITVALLIALQSAILSVLLEWCYPIRNWKIEGDLWHHPRKYIVPLIMLLSAVLIGMRSVSIWILLCIVIVECFSLSLIARRI